MSPTFFSCEDLHQEADLVSGVLQMLREVRDHDGVEALSEAFVRGIMEDAGHRHVVAESPGSSGGARVWGIFAVDANHVAEIAVHPEHRHQSVAGDLLRAAREKLGLSGPLDVWAHGDLAAAQGFVASLDARRTRELLKMRLEVKAGSRRQRELLEAAARGRELIAEQGYEVLNLPDAVQRFGEGLVDEEWVRVNNEAFAWHPEQGGWDVPRLRRARDTGWFDPEGVWFLWNCAEEPPELMGFHWTKIAAPDELPEAPGEVYVVCLADAARGQGLGAAVSLVGMEYLLQRGCNAIELYVEGDNAPAVATYRRLGFEVVHTDVVYRGVL